MFGGDEFGDSHPLTLISAQAEISSGMFGSTE